MTYKEYKKKKAELENNYINSIAKLDSAYAYANNTVQEGDIITDHLGSILVDSITVDSSVTRPTCVYCGYKVKLDGKIYKNRKRRTVYQCNLL